MEDLKKSLKDAILSNDMKKVMEILDPLCKGSEFEADEITELLSRSLYEAVSLGQLESMKLLIDYGADANYYEDPIKQSILTLAVAEGEDFIKILLENGANVNHRNKNGQSDFMNIMSSGKLPYRYLISKIDLVSDIYENDLRTGGSYLHLVSNRYNDDKLTRMIKKLLERGLSVNGKDYNDNTPLLVMATVASCSCMRFLLDNGADIKVRNRLGETVLHNLSSSNEFNGFVKCLKLLIERGVDVNEVDFEGRTAVHHALMSKETNKEAIRALINCGVKLNMKDLRGRNEIFYAVEYVTVNYSQSDLEQRADVIRFLVNAGVDVNEGDIYGITPLHMATMRNELEILSTLIDSGADVMKKSNTGATALHWACRVYNMAHVILYVCLQDGHDINIRDNHGSTALHWAVWFRELSVAQSLLQIDCDATIRDIAGNSPAELAKTLYFSDFLEILANDKYKTLEPLTLKDPFLECKDSDPVFACPLLRYIKKANHQLYVNEYIEHLKLHKTSITKCVYTSLGLRNMGLYYDIEENLSVPDIITQLMLSLNSRVQQRNPLFRCEIRSAGSMLEGTKVKLPDEFDYLWILSEFCETFIPVESNMFPDSFVKLKLKNVDKLQTFAKYLNRDNFLDCRLLLRDLYCLMKRILKEPNNSQFANIMCLQFLNEILCSTSSLGFQFFGTHAKCFRISVDVVPTIWFDDWTPNAFSVDNSMLLQVKENDFKFSVIIKTPDRCHVQDFTLFYKISYAYLEQCILKEVPYFIKKGYIILKTLTESGYFPRVVDHDNGRVLKQYVTSYHLKTCFLHELEKSRRENEKQSTQINESDNMEISLKWPRRITEMYPGEISGILFQSS